MFFMHNEDDDLSARRLFLFSLESKEGHSRYGNDYPSHTWQKTFFFSFFLLLPGFHPLQ